MVGKCGVVSPGDVVKNLESLMSSFQESLHLIRPDECAFSWKCTLSQPWAKKIKADSRKSPRKRGKCKCYIKKKIVERDQLRN